MELFRRVFCFVIYMASIGSVAVKSVADWDFNVFRFEYNTSNPGIADFDFRIIRSKSGEYAFNGSFVLGVDLDDNVSVWVKIYRSASGSSQYKETPYAIPSTSFFKFMTNIYVKMMQNECSKCTNMPVHTLKFDTPLAKGRYYVNMCVLSNENMPTHMQPGFYMLTAQFSYENELLYMSGFGEIYAKPIG